MNREGNATALTVQLNHFVFVSGLGRQERMKGGKEGGRKVRVSDVNLETQTFMISQSSLIKPKKKIICS